MSLQPNDRVEILQGPYSGSKGHILWIEPSRYCVHVEGRGKGWVNRGDCQRAQPSILLGCVDGLRYYAEGRASILQEVQLLVDDPRLGFADHMNAAVRAAIGDRLSQLTGRTPLPPAVETEVRARMCVSLRDRIAQLATEEHAEQLGRSEVTEG